MRLRKRGEVKRPTLFMAMATLIVGLGLAVSYESRESPSTKAAPRPAAARVSGSRSAAASPELAIETKRQLGVFDLGKGRRIRISTADTVDGMARLIEEADGAELHIRHVDGPAHRASREHRARLRELGQAGG